MGVRAVRRWHLDGVLMGERCSDYTAPDTRLPKILLNGNNVCMVGAPAGDGGDVTDGR